MFSQGRSLAADSESTGQQTKKLPPGPQLQAQLERQGKVRRERLKLLDLKTHCQFCSHKRKTVLLVQSDAGLERKKLLPPRP